MAVPFRSYWQYALCCLFLGQFLCMAAATPIPGTAALWLRDSITMNNASGTPIVIDTSTQKTVTQGSGSDGSGSDTSGEALVWIIFAGVVGPPMAGAGIRGWKMTSGVGIGLASALCAWAAVINTVSEVGTSDLIYVFIVIGFFGIGFAGGLFDLAVVTGITLVSITGGLAFGIRIVLLKDGLLFPGDLFFINWIIIAVCGGSAGICVIFRQRALITLGSASVGTFLISLAIDLVVNKQSGLSQGLRLLFDRNTHHYADIIARGYHPTILTQMILAVSLALTPALAYAQHRIFKHEFSRRPRLRDRSELNSANLLSEDDTGFMNDKKRAVSTRNKLKAVSRFSL